MKNVDSINSRRLQFIIFIYFFLPTDKSYIAKWIYIASIVDLSFEFIKWQLFSNNIFELNVKIDRFGK